MNWLLVAILAQLILGISGVFDKFLLRRGFFDPWVFTFWWGTLGVVSFVLLPFATLSISLPIMALALCAGIVFAGGMLTLFLALEKSEASTVLPLVGTLSPLASIGFSLLLLGGSIMGWDWAGLALLIIGAFLFFLAESSKMRFRIFLLSSASAVFFGLSLVLSKLVFDGSSFIIGFVFIKTGGILAVLAMLLWRAMRTRITESLSRGRSGNGLLYLANRSTAAAGSVLVSFAVSLSHPALVDATQGLRYAIIFIASWLILRERFGFKHLLVKALATGTIIAGLATIGMVHYARALPVDINRPITWGITFSSKFSSQLGLDWKENFNAVIRELRPKRLRLAAYWDEIEPMRGTYNFTDLDWQMQRAREERIAVILAVGMRVPRWPECHLPQWTYELNAESREDAVRGFVAAMVGRYHQHPALAVWQVENEPFLSFGVCPERPAGFLTQEIALVRALDSAHPILVTDSGEFGSWYESARSGDMFGTTMYRKVYPPSIGHLVGIIEYPIGPSFFLLKEKIIRALLGDQQKPFIVVELQGEPWGKFELPKLSYDEHISIFTPDYFKETIEYAKQTGFSEYYLWGAEWWYFAKEKHNNNEYWNIAGNLIGNQ